MARHCNTCGRAIEQRTRRGRPAEGWATNRHVCNLRLVAERTAVDLTTGERVTVERYVPGADESHRVVQRTDTNRARLAQPASLGDVGRVARADRRSA